jgi:phthalate 3,4-dioxygenase subunit beta
MSERGALLPYVHPDHQAAHQFLVEEAHLLDTLNFTDWLALVTDDIRYVMPARVTAANATPEASVRTIDHFAEDHYSLTKRVERFATDHAWTEDPPSRLRHHVSNVRTFATEAPDEWVVDSAVLLYRSRGDRQPASLLSAGRTDRLRLVDGALRLARRDVEIDDAVLRTQNLAVFL